jgi:hypothetical protein
MAQSDNFYEANLGFLLNYTDGYKKSEIESELYRICFQVREMTPYDRASGGSFENIEQEKQDESISLLFAKNIIESVYRLNESQNYDPYIIVDFTDVKVSIINGEYQIMLQYYVLQDLQVQGITKGINL